MNNLEEIILEREQLWKRIQEYIKGDALSEELHKAEEHLHNFMLDLGRLLLQETVEHHGTGDIGETHTHSGIERRRYGERKKTYLSVFGQIEIRRTYYWEEEEGGFCPLDEKLNLPDRRMSYLLQGWIQKRAVEKSYDEAIEDIGELLDLPLPKRTQEQITREASEVVSSFYEEKSAPPPEKEGSVIGVEADGKGIRMIPVEQPPVEAANESKVRRERGEKPGIRRMAVATALFTFEPEPRTTEEMVNILMRPKNRSRSERRNNGGENKGKRIHALPSTLITPRRWLGRRWPSTNWRRKSIFAIPQGRNRL